MKKIDESSKLEQNRICILLEKKHETETKRTVSRSDCMRHTQHLTIHPSDEGDSVRRSHQIFGQLLTILFFALWKFQCKKSFIKVRIFVGCFAIENNVQMRKHNYHSGDVIGCVDGKCDTQREVIRVPDKIQFRESREPKRWMYAIARVLKCSKTHPKW